MIMRNKS